MTEYAGASRVVVGHNSTTEKDTSEKDAALSCANSHTALKPVVTWVITRILLLSVVGASVDVLADGNDTVVDPCTV